MIAYHDWHLMPTKAEAVDAHVSLDGDSLSVTVTSEDKRKRFCVTLEAAHIDALRRGLAEYDRRQAQKERAA